MKAAIRLFSIVCVLGLGLAFLGQRARAAKPVPEQAARSAVLAPAGSANFIEVWFDLYTNNATSSVAWGDYDNDGDLDLAVGNHGQSQLYLNEGNGTLTLSAWSPPVNDTTSIAWGDYDNDGDLDLALGNRYNPNQVYENVGGEAMFILAWQDDDYSDTNSVAWGDYDGDGDLDLAAGNGWQDASPNKVYENDGQTLRFEPANGWGWQADDASYTSSVAWGDYDGDGDLDLASGNGYGWDPEVSKVYENVAGALYFSPTLGLGWQTPTSASTFSVAWGDYDVDGDLDLLLGNIEDPNRVYENVSGTLYLTPTLGLGWEDSGASYAHSAAWGDYDNDGDLDLAVGHPGWLPNQVYENVGGAEPYVLSWQVANTYDNASLAWGDYNGDGNLDLAVGNGRTSQQPNVLYENVRAATLQLDPANGLGWRSGGGDETTSVAWGDYDGDGDFDLAVGNGGYLDQPNKVYENVDGVLQLSPPTKGWISPISDATRSVAWGDYDGDGDLDLAVGNENEPNLVHENISGTLYLSPTLGLGWRSADSDPTQSVAWGDYDGDGDLDLAAGNSDYGMGPYYTKV